MPDSRDGLRVCPVLITGSYLELRLNLLEIGLCWRPNSMRWHAEGSSSFLPGTNLAAASEAGEHAELWESQTHTGGLL